MDRKLAAQLVLLFLITQALGLFVGNWWIRAVEETPEMRPVIINKNPEDPVNSMALLFFILAFTGGLLVAIKFLKGRLLYWLFKIFESLAIFSTALIVLVAFSDSVIMVLPALILVAARNIYSKELWLRNLSSVIATAGAGVFIGISLGVLPVVLLMGALALYDFIAVFKTKHMVTLAKTITSKNLSFTYALPTKEHTYELGTGDMVVPLTFAVSLLSAAKKAMPFPHCFMPSLVVLALSLGGLLWTMEHASKKPGRALPALPAQIILMLLGWGMMALAGIL